MNTDALRRCLSVGCDDSDLRPVGRVRVLVHGEEIAAGEVYTGPDIEATVYSCGRHRPMLYALLRHDIATPAFHVETSKDDLGRVVGVEVTGVDGLTIQREIR